MLRLLAYAWQPHHLPASRALHDDFSTMAYGSHCSTGQRLSIARRCHPAPIPHQGPTKEERAIEAAKQRNRQQQLQRFSDPAHGPFHLLTAERPTNTQQLKQQVTSASASNTA